MIIPIADAQPATIQDDDGDDEHQEAVSPVTTRRQRRKDTPAKQAAAGQVPREDIDDRTSSAVSDTDSSETSEYIPSDDTLGMDRLAGQKRRVSTTATRRKRTAIKRQARQTNEDASFPSTAAPARDQSHRRTSHSQAFRAQPPATAKLSAAGMEEMRKDLAAMKKTLDQVLERLDGNASVYE
ncbi:hypothetical protein THARTR1_03939 [Trichoderma harzianum]|uniref:Uncharacterized protein n=1 Tax=Trichoderma harzianum TaxID=5544 RepID=A0A2K0UE01_TRIHA|nr:hypothetical protein THARTR1_03939 [Trichoderma harzianum]